MLFGQNRLKSLKNRELFFLFSAESETILSSMPIFATLSGLVTAFICTICLIAFGCKHYPGSRINCFRGSIQNAAAEKVQRLRHGTQRFGVVRRAIAVAVLVPTDSPGAKANF